MLTALAINDRAKSALKALIHLAWPVIASRLGIQLMALADTVVVGHYSSDQLGYHMLAISISWVFAITGMGLTMGMQVKTAHFLGAKDDHKVGAVFQRGMAYATGLGFIFMVASIVLGPWLLRLFVTPDIAKGAHYPLIVFCIGIPFFMMSMAVSQFMEALGRTRDVMVSTLLANALNLILLFILVPSHFVWFGIECNGALGAAVATLIARIAHIIGIWIYVIGLKQVKAFDLLGRHQFDPNDGVEQRQVGYAAGASYFIEVSAFAGLSLFSGHAGAVVAASWAIVLNFASVVFMVPVGISAGCSVLVGQAYGAKNREEIALMGRISFITTVCFMVLVVLFMLVGLGPLTALYTHDAALIDAVKYGFLLSCLFYIPDGLQVVAAQALRARQDVLAPTLIHYISYGLIMLPLGYLFTVVMNEGIAGLVWPVIIASVISGTFQTARYLWLDRKLA